MMVFYPLPPAQGEDKENTRRRQGKVNVKTGNILSTKMVNVWKTFTIKEFITFVAIINRPGNYGAICCGR